MSFTYQNPVVRGCYPDPSVCRVGSDYYLVNSSFEFFPGIPVLHSRDLVHWTTIGHCLNRPDQLKLHEGDQSHSGIYAPSIRYYKDTFYMVTTNVTWHGGQDAGNFYMTAKNPAGPWSDPVFLETAGIDPSFFFDEDGSTWYVGTCDDGIYVQAIDFEAGCVTGSPYILWKGTGGAYPEGPHIYKRNGWYYLMISEGGTERCHMLTMARSQALTAGYTPCPHNPVMSNRSLPLPLQSVAHADLVEDENGDWWAVCLGTRVFSYPPRHNLGRETMLVPVDFSGDWPVFGNQGTVQQTFTVPRLPSWNEDVLKNFSDEMHPQVDHYTADFSQYEKDLSWNEIYNAVPGLIEQRNQTLVLKGNERKLSDAAKIAWTGRRQQHPECTVVTNLQFPCIQEGEEAGMTVFTNNLHHAAAALMWKDGQRKLIFRRQIGSLWKIEGEIPYLKNTVSLRIEADLDWYIFQWKDDGGNWKELGRAETIYLTTECGGAFTGNYIGLYAVGNGKSCITEAVFTSFFYDEGKL